MFVAESADNVYGIFVSLEKAKESIETFCNEDRQHHFNPCIYWTPLNNSRFWDDQSPDYYLIELLEYQRHFKTWKEFEKVKELDPITEFAYAVLSGDPQACDAVRDILKI